MSVKPSGSQFTRGYVCAVAEIIRSHGEDIIAGDVLIAAGLVDWSKIDAADREVLAKAGLAPQPSEGL